MKSIRTRVFTLVAVFLFFVVLPVYAEEAGLAQRLWRKLFKKQELERKSEKKSSEQKPTGKIITINLDEDGLVKQGEYEGLTPEEIEELKEQQELTEELKQQQEQRENLEVIRRAQEAQRRPPQVPRLPQ